MKRIYKEYSYGKKLVGYEYEGYYIDVEDQLGSRNLMYGATHRWYYVKLKSGKECVSDTLKEIKEKIDREIRENK